MFKKKTMDTLAVIRYILIVNGVSMISCLSLKPQEMLHTQTLNNKKIPQNIIKENAVERPLFIGSFNIQDLAKRKLNNESIMEIVAKIINRYDLIQILELRINESKKLEKFLKQVNTFAPGGIHYNMSVSSDPVVNEFIAIFYRTDKLKILKSESYYDPKNFYRRPFFVLFDSPTLREIKEFAIIGLHVKPDKAVREINALAGVYDEMKTKYKIEDILLMGDFNADCTYVSEKDWENIELWMRSDFTWAIGGNIDTTTNYRHCALDRFVYAGENMNEGVILSSAKAFDFRDELDVTMQEARAVSDHWPIEIKVRGKMSKLAEKHLKSETCFAVLDSRISNISRGLLQKVSTLAHFTTKNTSIGWSLQKETQTFQAMIDSILLLRKVAPGTITHEQVEAILYKSSHGALEDQSSNADEPDIAFKIDLSILSNSSKVLICRSTTIN